MLRSFSRSPELPCSVVFFFNWIYIVFNPCSLQCKLDDVGIFNHLGMPSRVFNMGARPNWSYPAVLTWLLAANPVLSHPKPTETVSTTSLETQYPPQIENARVILPADTGVSQLILVRGGSTDIHLVLSDQSGERRPRFSN